MTPLFPDRMLELRKNTRKLFQVDTILITKLKDHPVHSSRINTEVVVTDKDAFEAARLAKERQLSEVPGDYEVIYFGVVNVICAAEEA